MSPARLGGWAGMIGSALFVAVFSLEGALRPGYSPASMFISALSMGERGWIQIANFMVLGPLVLLFARGMASQFVAARTGPLLLALMGVSFFASGPFVMDQMGTPFPQMTWHGHLHQLFGAVVFSLGPASLFVFFARFRQEPEWQRLSALTLGAGVLMTLLVVLLKVAQLATPLLPWAGLVQRSCLGTWLVWVFVVSSALRKRG